MSDRFLKRIDKLLEEKNKMSLKILLEEEEESKGEGDEGGAGDDPFADAFGDEGGEGDDAPKASEGGEGDGEGDDEGDDVGDDEDGISKEKSAIDTLADLNQNIRQSDIIDNESSKLLSKYKLNPGSKIKLASSKIIKYDSIKNFVILEKEESKEREDIQTIISDYQEKIEDMEIDSYKGLKNKQSGTLIDISAEVENAMNQVKYFDNLFKKSEIVHDWFIDLIAKTAPADKKEDMIKQFKAEFNSKLKPADKFDIQSKPTSYNSMAGAKPTA